MKNDVALGPALRKHLKNSGDAVGLLSFEKKLYE
jgi:hypothetical protein